MLDTGDSGREAINIDFSYETGFPLFGDWDDTTSFGIRAEDCFFDGVQVAVGSHGATEPPSRQANIRISATTCRFAAT